ncbi:hypothetical protein Avbf_11324 [Armadillidium vulgare]|nr:hypothetical protein Avbf_11324 [Armadillidium vulgare]
MSVLSFAILYPHHTIQNHILSLNHIVKTSFYMIFGHQGIAFRFYFFSFPLSHGMRSWYLTINNFNLLSANFKRASFYLASRVLETGEKLKRNEHSTVFKAVFMKLLMLMAYRETDEIVQEH